MMAARQSLFSRVFGWRTQPEVQPVPRVDAYRVRKRALPNTMTAADRRRALDYWGGCCAICGKPPGLWHTVTLDHWIPISHADCPGTVPANLLPMCHGNDGCNNQKHAKNPQQWLVAKLGRRKAARKLEEIQYFFRWMDDPAVERANCPYCDKPVYYSQEDDTWECNYCRSTGFFTVEYDADAE